MPQEKEKRTTQKTEKLCGLSIYSKDTLPIITVYKLKAQDLELDINVISIYGKGFDIKLSTNYKFNRKAIVNISKLSNPIPLLYLEYELIPEIRFAARSIIGNYSIDKLDLKQAEKETLEFLRNRLNTGVIINSINIELIKNKKTT